MTDLDPKSPADIIRVLEFLEQSYMLETPEALYRAWDTINVVSDIDNLIAVGKTAMNEADEAMRRRDERAAEMALLQNAEEL